MSDSPPRSGLLLRALRRVAAQFRAPRTRGNGVSESGTVIGGATWEVTDARRPGAIPRAAHESGEVSQPPQFIAGCRILLVEDNPVNQLVAQRLLEKLGLLVTVANDGAQALDLVAASNFDAVLMDCQMPVIDGFTATKLIRAYESRSGKTGRLPIIALTANVTAEDRQYCMAAGMDAHLGKPVESAELAKCLRRFVGLECPSSAVDFDALREMTGGEAEFERELIATFIASGDQSLADIIEALEQRDMDTVGKRAHALKGASANIRAYGLCETAGALVIAAQSGNLTEVPALVEKLTVRLREVGAQLRRASN